MPTTRHASCQCGQLEINVVGEPIRSIIRLCYACQQRTGSVFGVQAKFYSHQLKMIGDQVSFVRINDNGEQLQHHFCPSCGTTVMMSSLNCDDTVIVPVGVFSYHDFPSPSFSVYEQRKRGWAKFDGEIDHFY